MIEWYAAIAAVWLWGKLSPRRRVLAYRIQKFRDRCSKATRSGGRGAPLPGVVPGGLPRAARAAPRGKIHPVVAERLPLSEARRAHELLESSAAKGKLVLVP